MSDESPNLSLVRDVLGDNVANQVSQRQKAEDPTKAARLTAAIGHYLEEPADFRPGEPVEWKPGLRAIGVDMDEPMVFVRHVEPFDVDQGAVHRRYDCVLGMLDSTDDLFMFYAHTRRLRPCSGEGGDQPQGPQEEQQP